MGRTSRDRRRGSDSHREGGADRTRTALGRRAVVQGRLPRSGRQSTAGGQRPAGDSGEVGRDAGPDRQRPRHGAEDGSRNDGQAGKGPRRDEEVRSDRRTGRETDREADGDSEGSGQARADAGKIPRHGIADGASQGGVVRSDGRPLRTKEGRRPRRASEGHRRSGADRRAAQARRRFGTSSEVGRRVGQASAGIERTAEGARPRCSR